MPERRIPLDLTTPCWQWPDYVQPHGYAFVMIDGERKYVHRLAYQLHVGPVPRSWEVDHACHSAAAAAGGCTADPCPHRACWNPAHLEAVTSRENSMRGNHPLFTVARKAECRRGHDLTIAENVKGGADGRRRCRVCANEYQRTRRAARCAA